MQFGLWLPVYGGWLRANGFDASPSFAECLDLAVNAEALGFSLLYVSENFLNCVHGSEHKIVDAWTLLAALGVGTERIRLAGALKPAFRPALVAAQMTATADEISQGRIEINIACGWWQEEFEICGADWRHHDDKYEHAGEYLRELQEFWAGNGAPWRPTFSGDRPPVWIGGHSDAALRFAARYCDVLFLNGMPPEGVAAMIERYRGINPGAPLPKIAMNAFIIPGATDEDALSRREAYLAAARPELIALYRSAMTAAGAQTWSALSDAELIDSNGGFATALCGSPQTLKNRIALYEASGVDLLVCQFPDMAQDSAWFAREIMRGHARAVSEKTEQFYNV